MRIRSCTKRRTSPAICLQGNKRGHHTTDCPNSPVSKSEMRSRDGRANDLSSRRHDRGSGYNDYEPPTTTKSSSVQLQLQIMLPPSLLHQIFICSSPMPSKQALTLIDLRTIGYLNDVVQKNLPIVSNASLYFWANYHPSRCSLLHSRALYTSYYF